VDVQQRTSEHGTGRIHTDAETGDGSLVPPLLATAKNGGLPSRHLGRLERAYSKLISSDAERELYESFEAEWKAGVSKCFEIKLRWTVSLRDSDC
jgi:hypothetical protein